MRLWHSFVAKSAGAVRSQQAASPSVRRDSSGTLWEGDKDEKEAWPRAALCMLVRAAHTCSLGWQRKEGMRWGLC